VAAYLTNQFLIAMPAMDDPNFAQTVTLVCEHSERAALARQRPAGAARRPGADGTRLRAAFPGGEI
jgi:hypothetical protein